MLAFVPAILAQPASPQVHYPDASKILFWSPQEKPFGFRNMEKVLPGHAVKRGPRIHPLPYASAAFEVSYRYKDSSWNTARFMEANNVAGLLVIHEGTILLERYALGFDERSRWTSFSVAKSVTSTLLGVAIRDGNIPSIDEPVTRYLPGLKDSAYEGVSIRHVLNMTSGVKWNEDYTDAASDVSRFAFSTDASRGSPLVTYMAKLPREAAPGEKFVYKTGETNLAGEIVMAATKKKLADYLSEKIWAPSGMEQDAFWIAIEGRELAGCCLSMSLRDYGRFALFFLKGASEVTPPNWAADAVTATEASRSALAPGSGYGYQWWVGIDGAGTYSAIGIFGQRIYFNPARKLIAVVLSAWPAAQDRGRTEAVRAFQNAVADAVNITPSPLP